MWTLRYLRDFVFKLDDYNSHEEYDFQVINKTIQEYYAIDGSLEHFTPQTIKQFSGYVKRAALIDENFFNAEIFRDRWAALRNSVEESLGREGESTYSLLGNCYSAFVTMKEEQMQRVIHSKQLHYFISLLGPYYTVYGMDSVTIRLREKRRSAPEEEYDDEYRTDVVAAISPTLEYEASFRLLQQKIKEKFPGYKFVPYDIGTSVIDGISGYAAMAHEQHHNDCIRDTVYTGLFGPEVQPICEIRGEEFYGKEDWLKPLSDQELDLSGEFQTHVTHTATLSGITTLHKVWKLKHHAMLPTVPPHQGGGMGSISLMEVMDLVDPARIIAFERNRNAPAAAPYTIEANKLKFMEEMFYEVIQLTDSQLSIILHLNLPEGIPFFKNGPFAELIYEPMSTEDFK